MNDGIKAARAGGRLAGAGDSGSMVDQAEDQHVGRQPRKIGIVQNTLNETFANWQAIWLCAGFVGLAVILLRARDPRA